MNFLNIYINVLKNDKNYNIILYLKLLKYYFLENGLKILLIENWYKFGIKYNLILKLLD